MKKLFTSGEVKTIDKDEGTFEIVASSGKVDRLGDVIDPKGWYLTNYRKNPVILWSHMSGGFGTPAIPPVAQAIKVWVEDEKELKVKGLWADTPFARELRTLVEGGFLRAVSVGFLPLVEDEKGNIEIEGKFYRRAFDEEIVKGVYGSSGRKFTKQELLEVSWVCVPALPTALVTARKMNLPLLTKALEEIQNKETEEVKFEPYFDTSGYRRYRAEIECPNCKEKRWVDRRNIQKENFTGLCEKCFKSLNGKSASGYKEGKWYQSNGYVGILASEVEPKFQCMKDCRGYIYEHRYAMAKKLGRPLEEFEQVHHLNGIKDDNRIENLELVGDNEHLLITRMQQRIRELEERLGIIKPLPTEHSCRLQPPDKYKRFRRENCAMKHDGKCIDVIWGITKGEEEKVEMQSMRYNKETWTEESARTHCKEKGGSFEAASEKELLNIRKELIQNCVSKMEEAINILKEFLSPEKDIVPSADKGRKIKPKLRSSDMEAELKVLSMVDKALEILRHKLINKLKEK